MEFKISLEEHTKNLQYNNNFTAFVRKAKVAGLNPEIGIFWVLPEKNNKVVGEKIPLRDASPAPSQFKDIERSHDEVWDANKRKWGYDEEEYFEIPRGRLLFDAKQRKFILISSTKIIKDPEMVNKILSFFSISQYEPILKADVHYESPADIDWDDDD